MIKRSRITPIQLLSSEARARIEQQMRDKFTEFDSDNDRYLSREEFDHCMGDSGLILSTSEIELLFQRADLNKDGRVDEEEWQTFAYGTLLHLQRDVRHKEHVRAVYDILSLAVW